MSIVTSDLLPLYEYDCGCVGFPTDDEGNAIIVQPCQHPAGRGTIELEVQSMKGKNSTVWKVDNNKHVQPDTFFQDLKRLLLDGVKWRAFMEMVDKK